MGIQINGNTDNISAVDGDLSITGITTFSQLDVGSNIKLGNAGVITATSFVGDGSGLTGAGPSLTGSTNNTIVTVTGANAIQGEGNLTYDGSTLQVATDTNMEGIKIVSSGDTYNDLIMSANRSGANNHIGRLLGQWNGGNAAAIVFNTGGDTSSKDDGEILFSTSNGGSSLSTRMVIKQNGNIGIDETSPTRKLDVNGDVLGVNFMFKSNSSASAGIGAQIFRPANNTMAFATNGANTRLLINSNGDVTTTGATTFVRSNAGFTARAGDSVNIARASGTPLEIVRTGNDGQMINFFRDTTGVAQIRWDGSFLTMGAQADPDVLKVGSTVDVTKKLKVDFSVSGSDYVAYFRNSNANSYGVAIQEPSSVNTGYPLLSVTNSSGQSHFRVDTAGLVYANSGAGTDKKAYFVRAWVNFDGQGGSAGQNRSIQDSQNVSSVYDNDAGDFTINFTTNMPTSAYVVCGMGANWENNNSDSYIITSAYKNSTNLGSCRVRTIRARFDQQPPQFRDSNENMIAIIC